MILTGLPINKRKNKNTVTIEPSDKLTNLRAKFSTIAGGTPTEAAPTEPAESGPLMSNWDIVLKDDKVIQTYGFLSFNPVGAVFATATSKDDSVVNVIVPWDNVASIERVEDESAAA